MLRNLIMGFYLIIFSIGCDRTLSTSPPDPEPPNGTIFITSVPEGYQIYLDNRISGFITPATLTFMEEKEYFLELKHPLYLDTLININLQGGEESYFLDVEKSPRFLGEIECRSYPGGAEIYLDDSLTNKQTPARLNNVYPGIHLIRYELLGHREAERIVTVASNDSARFTTDLQDTTIWLTFNRENSRIPSQDLTSIAIESTLQGDKLWAATTDNGFFSMQNYHWFSVNSENTTMTDKYISKILIDRNGTKWAASVHKVYSYNNDGIFHIYEDHQYNDIAYRSSTHTFWFSIEGKGILKRRETEEVFYTKDNSPLTDDYVQSIDVFGDTFAAGFNDKGFIVIHETSQGDEWHIFDENYLRTIGPQPENISTIKVFTFGNITKVYAAVHHSGIYIVKNLETREGEFMPFDCMINSFNVDYHNDILWVGTSEGLYKIRGTEIVDHYTTFNSPLESNFITDVELGEPIWIATVKGLVRFKNY